MKQADEIEELRDRLSKLSEASLRLNETLDLDNVLDEVVHSAQMLTNARYGVLTALDDEGQLKDVRTSG